MLPESVETFNHNNFKLLLAFYKSMVAEGRVPVTYSDEEAEEQANATASVQPSEL